MTLESLNVRHLPEQSQDDDCVLMCRNMNAFYERIQVVFDIDLDVKAGECLAVLGANGAGKTSLLGAISGVVTGSGDVRAAQHKLTGVRAHNRAKLGISYVPEARRNMFSTMTVQENLDIGLGLAPRDSRDETISFLFEMFPILKERLSAGAGMLSGGEQQMLAMAMALGRNPSVVLLDEPSQGLAPAIFDVLENAFAQLKTRKIGILLAEQNLTFASQVSDRFIVINQGRITSQGSRSDMADYQKVFAAYMQ